MKFICFISISFARMAQPGYRSGLQNRYSWVQIPLCAYLKKIKIFIIIYIESERKRDLQQNTNNKYNLMVGCKIADFKLLVRVQLFVKKSLEYRAVVKR